MEFNWDDGNRDKSLFRHNVHDWEIEEAFDDPRALPGDTMFVGGEIRETILARCYTSGSYLRIVYTRRARAGQLMIRPISARHMTAAERARYSI